MDNYRITIEPISPTAMLLNPNPVSVEAAGYILGAIEIDPRQTGISCGEPVNGSVHTNIQGICVPDIIIHMINNLPEQILESVAMRILERRFGSHDSQQQTPSDAINLRAEFEQFLREAGYGD